MMIPPILLAVVSAAVLLNPASPAAQGSLDPSPAAQGSLDIFTAVPEADVVRVHENEVATRQRNVFMDLSLLESKAEAGLDTYVNFNLFEDVTIVGVLEDIENVYADGKIYHFDTGNGFWNYAAISIINNAVSGVVRMDGATYTINNVGDGQYTVAETDWDLAVPCGVDSSHNVFDLNPQPKKNSNNRSHDRHVAHIMIVFTTNTVTAEGGLDGANSLANLSISEMNRSLANGDSEFRVNLVHTYEDTTYVQSGSQGDDLSRFRDTSDGHLDAVHGLRDAYGADYCQLFIATYGTGIAYVNCSDSVGFESSAFSVSKNTRAAWDYTLAHELGHNMGLRHNHAGSGASTTCSDRDYCFGYRSTNYRTVMAYNPGSVLPIYSNPYVNDPDGAPLGTTTLEDSSRHIGEWKDNFISYRGGVSIYHQIETTFDGGNGGGGNMFDIKPKADISLTGIAINTMIAAGTTAMVDVYYREGTWVGHDNSSSGWTLLESLSGPSEGSGIATILEFDLNTGQDKVFEVDKTYGIFIAATNGVNGDFRYTNDVDTFEDSYIRLETGCGKTYGGFGGSTYSDRLWNGILYYDGAWGEHYLNTTLASDISTFTGNMFDIEVHEDVVISSFDVNVNTAAGSCAGVDIWYKSGSYVGSENEPMDWTFLGTDHKAVSNGPDVYTPVAISSPELLAGNTYAFYVRSSNGDTINYTSGSSTWGNSDMTITCGAGLGGTDPFRSALAGRTWNGRLRYRASADFPHMTIDDIVGGESGSITISNCTPGGTVRAAYSLKGGGPTSTSFGTVFMTRPWTDFPTFTADANGEAGMTVSPPAVLTGRTVWMQCLDWDSKVLSNGVATTIL